MNKSYRVGDKIVEYGRVYRIFKVEKETIYFRPFFKSERDNCLTCSIPIENIVMTKIRRPVSEERMSTVFSELSKEIKLEDPVDVLEARKALSFNRPKRIAQTIRELWFERQDENMNFSRNKQQVFDLLITRLAEEVAVVAGTSLLKAREKLNGALGTSV